MEYRHDWYITHARANQDRRRDGAARAAPSDQRQPETRRGHSGRNDCMGDNDTSSRPPEDRGEPGSTRQQGRCLRSYDTEPTVASHVILGVYYRIRVNDM